MDCLLKIYAIGSVFDLVEVTEFKIPVPEIGGTREICVLSGPKALTTGIVPT